MVSFTKPLFSKEILAIFEDDRNINTLTRRQNFPLFGVEKEDFVDDRNVIKSQIRKKARNGISPLFANHNEFAKTIVDLFDDPTTLFVMGIAQMQVGKTGAMISFIEQYIDRYEIPISNIYIITGLSSKSWIKQVKKRFPGILETQIYHRNDLTDKFTFDVMSKNDSLVIIDEVQIAAQKKQTMHTTFDELCFANRQNMYEKNIKVVEFSATPDGVLKDRQNWDVAAEMVIGEPGVGYKGVFDFLDEGRVFQCKELSGYSKKEEEDTQDAARKNIAELGHFIFRRYGSDNPKYHIIRTPTGESGQVMMSNIKEIYGEHFKYKTYNGMSEEEDINEILDIEPIKHTCIFIMELCRCADTINKKYVGVLYERNVKRFNDSAQTQGLPGRACGYDDTGETIIFANIDSLTLYRQHYESKFTRTDLPWNCNSKNGTYASEDSESESGSDNGEKEYGYKVFENDQRYFELEVFTRSHLDGWVPRPHSGKNINELRKHTSRDLIARHWGLSNKNPKRLALGTDGKWVVWWLTKFYPGV